MPIITIAGVLASTFTALSLLPQLVKLLKEKKAGDVSVGMLACLLAGIACWIWYGFLRQDVIIIISNSVSLLLNIATSYFTLKYR